MAIGLSILEQEDALKGLPTQALQQMMRQPSPDAPPFLVAAELKRREQMKKEFVGKQAEAQTAQQAPTVAHRLAGQQQPMPMSQAGAMAAPPQQPPMPKEAQLAMALSGATGRPPPELPTVNAQEGFSGAAVREIAKALRKEGTRTYAQKKAHQPFSSRERPSPVYNEGGLGALITAIVRAQSEKSKAYGGFDISEDIRLPRGRGRTVAAARPVAMAEGGTGSGTTGDIIQSVAEGGWNTPMAILARWLAKRSRSKPREDQLPVRKKAAGGMAGGILSNSLPTTYAQDGFRFSPEQVLDVERTGVPPWVQQEVLRRQQDWAERPGLGVGAEDAALSAEPVPAQRAATEAVGEQYRQYGEEMARRGPPPSSVGVPRFTEAELFAASDPVEQDGQSGTGAEVLFDPPPAPWLEPTRSEILRRIDEAETEVAPVPKEFQSDLSQGAFVPRTDAPTQRKFRVGPQTEMLIGSLRLNERAEGMPADQLLSEIEENGRLPEGFDGKGVDPQILRRANLQALLAVQEARAPGLEINVAQREAALSRQLVEPGTLRPDERARLAAEDQPQVDRGYKNNPEKPPGTITLAGGPGSGVTGTSVDRDGIQRRILDALDGVATGPAKKVDATAVAEKARAAGDAMRESLGKKTRTLIDQQDASIDKIAKADKAGLKKISESMTALKDFQETGRLPKKHRDALINAGLMEFGAALLDPNNPTLYGAFSAGLRGFQKIEKGKRKEYLEGLKYALTAETAQQEMAMKIRNSEAVARRSLAQFQIAQQSRDETAAAAAEKRYTDATNDARRFEIMERTAATGKLSALATILNAIKPDKDARMFNMLLKGKLEEAQALAEQGDVKLLNEAFIYDEKTHKATPRMGYFIDLFASMDPAAAYRAMAGAQTLGHQQRTEARAVDRIVSAKVEDLTKGWNTSADWLKIHPEKRMPSVAEWQDDKERARLIALARAWVQRRTPGWQPSQGQRNSDPVNLR